MQIRFGFALLGKALCQPWVYSHVRCIFRVVTGCVCVGGGGQPCQKSSWCTTVFPSPTRDAGAHLFRYVSLALRHGETVTEASGTWQSLAELNRLCLKAQWQEISLRSQKAALIASDMCIPFPSDATSLFCLDHLCVSVCIFALCVCALEQAFLFLSSQFLF